MRIADVRLQIELFGRHTGGHFDSGNAAAYDSAALASSLRSPVFQAT